MQTLKITDFPGLRIGQAQNEDAATGVTVLICEEGMAASIDVRGGGPASRDTRVLEPDAAAQAIHAVVLSGGSAYGLDAAGGVMRYLEERGIGLPVGDAIVPLVCQSSLFDLGVGRSDVRPDADMAYAACVASEQGNYRNGNYGAGCGASVGKLMGPNFSMKSGIGSFCMETHGLVVGAIVAVNAVGNVIDPFTGRTVAGMLNPQRTGMRDTAEALAELWGSGDLGAGQTGANTAIGAVLANARFDKGSMRKLASMAHDGLARAVAPIHTTMDGDAIYALSLGDAEAPLDVVGVLAAHCMAQAVLCAARSARGAYGLPAACDFEG